MNAYILQTDKTVEPFGDHPGDCLIGNRRLADIQEDLVRGLGLEVRYVPAGGWIDDPREHLTIEDSLFFTGKLLREFLAGSRKQNRCTVCVARRPGPTILYNVVATQDIRADAERVEYGLRYTPAAGHGGETLPVVIDVVEHLGTSNMPEHMWGCREAHISISEKAIFQIDHWTNLHDANVSVAFGGAARMLNRKAAMLGWVLRARSPNQWKIGRRASRIGRNCNIHPSAWIEYSDIGDNVTIGPGTVVSLSVVGSDCWIGSNVTVEYSVLGGRCWVGSSGAVRCALLYPGVLTMARLINLAVCGRDSFLGDGVTLSDYRLDARNVAVMKNGQSVDTGCPVCGVCLGHGVYLGAGCIVAPGRAIPNGMRLVQDRSRYITAIGADGSVPGYRLISAAPGSRPKPEAALKTSRAPLLQRLLRTKAVK